MPNIKLYGLNDHEAEELFNKIQKTFKDELYADEIVVTTIPSTVRNLKEKSQPYIQLELTNSNVDNGIFTKMVPKLVKLKIDIQHTTLTGFISRE